MIVKGVYKNGNKKGNEEYGFGKVCNIFKDMD